MFNDTPTLVSRQKIEWGRFRQATFCALFLTRQVIGSPRINATAQTPARKRILLTRLEKNPGNSSITPVITVSVIEN